MTRRMKADAFAAFAIAIALPGYYKARYWLEGQLTLESMFQLSTLVEIGFAFLLACLVLFVYRQGAHWVERARQAWLRRVLPIALLILAAAAALAFTRFFFTYVAPWGTQPSFEFDIVLLTLLLPLIVSGIADRIFLEGAARRAENAALSARLELLNARLSPHFLFNSLNTLADMVEENPELSVQYIEEMAAVYRYILNNSNVELVSLSAELNAVRSLLHILEGRQPGALRLDLNLTRDPEQSCIVPLALQTLIENALKHNFYSPGKPLEVRIYSDHNDLIVENSLNLKSDVPSTATGLATLRDRVTHICGRPLRVDVDENRYRARVPLVALPT